MAGIMIKILDLYSGMGGLSLGFVVALDAEVLGVDIDQYAVDTYNLNLKRFGARAVRADVLRFRPDSEFDLIIGGVPCQPWSYAVAHAKGRSGERHPLAPTLPRFFDLIIQIKPKAFLMENVEGLATRYRDVLERELAEARGEYNIAMRVLDAADYGVPQHRRRLFVLGIRKDLGIKPSFPQPTHAEKTTVLLDGTVLKRWITVREAIGDLLSLPPVGAKFLTPEQVEKIKQRRKDTSRYFGEMEFPDPLDKPSRTIATATVLGGTKREAIVIAHIGGGELWRGNEWANREISLGEPSYTIVSKHRSGQVVETPYGYRTLTPREAMRLQSFPDWFTFPSGISKSKMFQLIGDAVPPILAFKLAQHVGRLLALRIKEPDPQIFQLPYYHLAF